MVKRVVLVVPNYKMREQYGNPSAPPLGVALIAGALRDIGVEVFIIDGDAENLTNQEVVSRIISYGVEVVGISCNYISKENPSIELSGMLKNEGMTVFWGGNHATSIGSTMKKEYFKLDYLLKGEGEVSVPLFIEALNGKSDIYEVPGLVHFEDDMVLHGAKQMNLPSLSNLPSPAYDLLPMERYSRYGILTSRGCPYCCAYCASTSISGRNLRFRQPESVVEEMVFLETTYGIRKFWFMDDTFTASRKNLEGVLEVMEKNGKRFNWSCLSSVAFSDFSIMKRMKANGCEYISVGVESTHPEHSQYIGKPMDEESVIKVVKCAQKAGLRIYGFFILGFPGESSKTVESRYRIIEKARFDDVAVNILIPLPGTALWDQLTFSGQLDPGKMDKDSLFARVSDKGDSYETAELAEKWTKLSAPELLNAVNKCRSLGRDVSPNYVERVL